MTFIREDDENVELAISLGFEVDYSTKQQNGLRFIKGPIHIWAIKSGWQCADLVDGVFCYHRPSASLKEALINNA